MKSNAGYTVVLPAKSQMELEESWLRYEGQEIGLGVRFAEEALRKINSLAAFPEVHGIKNRQYREAVVPVFPFVIIYRIMKRKKLIEVVSVFHMSRNPKDKY